MNIPETCYYITEKIDFLLLRKIKNANEYVLTAKYSPQLIKIISLLININAIKRNDKNELESVALIFFCLNTEVYLFSFTKGQRFL